LLLFLDGTLSQCPPLLRGRLHFSRQDGGFYEWGPLGDSGFCPVAPEICVNSVLLQRAGRAFQTQGWRARVMCRNRRPVPAFSREKSHAVFDGALERRSTSEGGSNPAQAFPKSVWFIFTESILAWSPVLPATVSLPFWRGTLPAAATTSGRSSP